MPCTINFAVPGGLTFATPQDNSVYSISSRMVSPRVGFAWTPAIFKDRTVNRGGFGLFVQPIAMSNLNPSGGYSSSPVLTQEGFSQTTQFPVPSPLLLPTADLSNPFPSGILDPAGSSAGLTTFLGQSVDFFSAQMKNPYSERWTLGVQQQLTSTLLMGASADADRPAIRLLNSDSHRCPPRGIGTRRFLATFPPLGKNRRKGAETHPS
jgi:hypothetical protein